MIQTNVLARYSGCSPISPQPTAVLELSADGGALKRVLSRPVKQLLRDFLRELPESGPLLRSFSQEEDPQQDDPAVQGPGSEGSADADFGEMSAPEVQPDDLEKWVLRWLDALQSRAGAFRLEKPRLLSRGMAHERALLQGLLSLRVQFDLNDLTLQELLEWLRWSSELWEWALRGAQRRSRRDLLATAPPSHPGPKPSLLAMARHVADLRLDWRFEQLHRGMPVLVIGRGQGLRRVSQKLTDQTGGWGLQCVKQKILTARLLAGAGLPVAEGRLVGTLREAVDHADRLGYPVVTKPVNEDQGKGVVTNIENRQSLLKAYRRSEAAGRPVLLQSHISGRDYRFYVVRGKLLAALERIPAQVIGDGRSSVRKLVEAQNLHRRTTPITVEAGEKIRFSQIALDQEAKHLLKAQALTPESVPAEGQAVRLSPSANFSMGGTLRECLAEVHPTNHLLLEKVARLFHLDIVGIDVIAPTISVPLQDCGGVICEVNGMPGVLPHQLAEPERPLMAETVSLLLEDVSCPPLIAVHGGGEAPAVMSTLRKVLTPAFPLLTVVDRQGRRQGEVIWRQGDCRDFMSQRQALNDPDAQAFLMELDAQCLRNDGLGWMWADVLLLLDGDSDLLPSWERWLVSRAALVLAAPARRRSLLAHMPGAAVMEMAEAPDAIAEQVLEGLGRLRGRPRPAAAG